MWCNCCSYNLKPSGNTDLYLTVQDRKIFYFLPPELPVGKGVFRASHSPALREAGSRERKVVVGWTQKFEVQSPVHLWSGDCLSISLRACSPKCSGPLWSCLPCHTAWRVPLWQGQPPFNTKKPDRVIGMAQVQERAFRNTEKQRPGSLSSLHKLQWIHCHGTFLMSRLCRTQMQS